MVAFSPNLFFSDKKTIFPSLVTSHFSAVYKKAWFYDWKRDKKHKEMIITVKNKEMNKYINIVDRCVYKKDVSRSS